MDAVVTSLWHEVDVAETREEVRYRGAMQKPDRVSAHSEASTEADRMTCEWKTDQQESAGILCSSYQ